MTVRESIWCCRLNILWVFFFFCLCSLCSVNNLFGWWVYGLIHPHNPLAFGIFCTHPALSVRQKQCWPLTGAHGLWLERGVPHVSITEWYIDLVPRIPGLFIALGDFSSFGLLLGSSSLNCLEDRLPHSEKGLEDPRCVEMALECSSGRMVSADYFRLLVGLCRGAWGISQASELKRVEVKRAVRSGKKFPIDWWPCTMVVRKLIFWLLWVTFDYQRWGPIQV